MSHGDTALPTIDLASVNRNCAMITGTTTTNTGMAFIKQDQSDAADEYCEFQITESTTTNNLIIEVTPVLPIQSFGSDADYDADLDPAFFGLFRFVPGGTGIGRLRVS